MTSFQIAGPILDRQRTLIRHATRQSLFTHCDKDGETRLGSMNWYLHVVHDSEIGSSCIVNAARIIFPHFFLRPEIHVDM